MDTFLSMHRTKFPKRCNWLKMCSVQFYSRRLTQVLYFLHFVILPISIFTEVDCSHINEYIFINASKKLHEMPQLIKTVFTSVLFLEVDLSFIHFTFCNTAYFHIYSSGLFHILMDMFLSMHQTNLTKCHNWLKMCSVRFYSRRLTQVLYFLHYRIEGISETTLKFSITFCNTAYFHIYRSGLFTY